MIKIMDVFDKWNRSMLEGKIDYEQILFQLLMMY